MLSWQPLIFHASAVVDNVCEVINSVAVKLQTPTPNAFVAVSNNFNHVTFCYSDKDSYVSNTRNLDQSYISLGVLQRQPVKKRAVRK